MKLLRRAPVVNGLAPHGKSSALMIGQSEPSATELLPENAVFLLKVFDDRILLTGDPTGHSSDEDLPAVKDNGHRVIVATPRNNRQLSAGGETA